MPAVGVQWNFTKRDSPRAFTSRKVWTPKPCMVRKLRGSARSDMTHSSMWVDSGISETKSQNVSWALAAWGIPWCGSGLSRVHQVGELHRVLDEEDRDVVADDVEVPLVGVELRGEPADVARRVDGAALARDGREAHEDRRALALLGQERGPRVLLHRLVALEEAVRGRAAGVDDPLGDALVVEVGDLLAEDEVFQQSGAAQAGLERVLVVGDRLAEVRREHLPARVDPHPVERLVARIEAGTRLGARLGAEARLTSVNVLPVTAALGASVWAPGLFGPSALNSAALSRLKGNASATALVSSCFLTAASPPADVPGLLGPATVDLLAALVERLRRTMSSPA